MLGVIGCSIGIALAMLICFIQVKWHIISLKGGTFLVNYFPVKIVATDILLVAVTALIIAFVAAWFPAYKASGQGIELK